MRIPICCVHGTWGADFDQSTVNQWWEPGSAFTQFLEREGFDPTYCEPFVWSGNVDGIAGFWPWNWFRSPEKRTWRASGRALRYLLKSIPRESRNVIAHSHGGNVGLCAAADGLELNCFVSVGTPVREDMELVARAARANIGYWLHLYDPKDDRMQAYGGLGDRHLGVMRTFELADENLPMEGGHSAVLSDPKRFDLWRLNGWLDFIRKANDASDHA